MDASNHQSSRFTVVNSDSSSNLVCLSESLLAKLSPQNGRSQTVALPSQISEQLLNEPESLPKPTIHSTLDASKEWPDVQSTEDSSSRYADSAPDGQQNKDDYIRHEASGSALRDEYELKLKQSHQEWHDRFKEIEQLNQRLFKQNSEKLATAVDEVETKYAKKYSFPEMPCKAIESRLQQCYTENAKTPLLCMEQVKAFTDCVKNASFETLSNSL